MTASHGLDIKVSSPAQYGSPSTLPTSLAADAGGIKRVMTKIPARVLMRRKSRSKVVVVRRSSAIGDCRATPRRSGSA